MDDGSYVDYPSSDITGIVNSRLAISSDQCNTGVASTQPVYLVETNPDNFLGVYQPDPTTTLGLLNANSAVSVIKYFLKSTFHT